MASAISGSQWQGSAGYQDLVGGQEPETRSMTEGPLLYPGDQQGTWQHAAGALPTYWWRQAPAGRCSVSAREQTVLDRSTSKGNVGDDFRRTRADHTHQKPPLVRLGRRTIAGIQHTWLHPGHTLGTQVIMGATNGALQARPGLLIRPGSADSVLGMGIPLHTRITGYRHAALKRLGIVLRGAIGQTLTAGQCRRAQLRGWS